MKWLLIFILSALAVFGIVKTNGHKDKRNALLKGSNSSFAILELFTSEGCSSCPPADRLLPQLAGLNENVIPLSFHVDYWDRLGWKDPFSNAQFTDRQKEYGEHFKLESIYTPQLIINGNFELVGSNKAAAEADIKKSLAERGRVTITVGEVNRDHEKLSVNCNLVGDWQNTNLLAAIIQKHAEMNVKAGENRGAKLSHTNVVRTFLQQPAKQKMNFDIAVPGDIAADNLPAGRQGWQLIIYTQQRNDLKITGAAVYNL